MVAHSKEHVAKLVEQYLRKNPANGSAVEVVADDVRLADSADEWWWVPVSFDGDPHKRYVYSMLLADIEEQIEEKEHLNVLLVPRPIVSAEHTG